MSLAWYVHHHGSGHLNRACAVASVMPDDVRSGLTGLSTLPRPESWPGSWVRLPSDDVPVTAGQDMTARGRLHWAPYGEPPIARRAGALSTWLAENRPGLLVSDVSVETALLARLHGVRVASVVLPGRRDDPAHQLGYDVSESLVAAWPEQATSTMVTGMHATNLARITAVGAISRFAGRAPREMQPGTVTALLGAGGDDLVEGWADRARRLTPGWRWTVLGGSEGTWSADPWTAISSAEVVVTHAGQGALADVAASRRPAVVVPMARPFDEQRHTARVLADGPWPAVVQLPQRDPDWQDLLERARVLDGDRWTAWGDRESASRMAEVLVRVLRGAHDLEATR